MKFPYGMCDFKTIISEGYAYCDRSGYIPLIEQGRYLLFLRPRRFGKSLLLSMLANYYDFAKADLFETLFGELEIGRRPTPLHNKYFMLQWDFSCVDPSGDAQDIKRSLYNHINGCIEEFVLYYRDELPQEIFLDPDDALRSIKSLNAVVRTTGHPIYLLIDEYDNFANEVLMGVRQGQRVYEALVFEEGPLKTLFKAIKSSTKDSMFERIFITGVSPVVMSDITSGYNIAESISTDDAYNALCGFTEGEIQSFLDRIAEDAGTALETSSAMRLMRTYYNRHQFAVDAVESIYNPTLALYFLKYFAAKQRFPRTMLDSNLATDEAKLRYIAEIPGGRSLLTNLNQEGHEVSVLELATSFGVSQMVSDATKDQRFLASLLYYFGVLTLSGETEEGELRLIVPNLVMRKLYVERLQEMLLPEPSERDAGRNAAKLVYTKGDMQPLVDFIEQELFRIFRNADYRWANELSVKTLFLSLLYNDTLFIMDSEPEVERRYPDLTMLIRPDMRRFKIFDVVVEFKYLTLPDLNMTAKQLRALERWELERLPIVTSRMADARKQASDYGDALQRKYPELRLKRFAVVAIGFERLCWEAVGEDISG